MKDLNNMPRKEEMTWCKRTNRWTRMHEGKRIWVSCRQLGTMPTREASRAAANAYWQEWEREWYAKNSPEAKAIAILETEFREETEFHFGPKAPNFKKAISVLSFPHKDLLGVAMFGRENWERMNNKTIETIVPIAAEPVAETMTGTIPAKIRHLCHVLMKLVA